MGWRRNSLPQESTLLIASANGRYLARAGGTPFLLFGQAAWELTQNLSDADVTTFLNDQQSRGVNLLLIDPIGKLWSFNSPNNLSNVSPFTGTTGGQEDFSTPRESFWAHVDWVVDQMAARGMVALLAPMYVGNNGVGDDGWDAELVANSQAKIESYGTFLGQRYGSRANVLWAMGGDQSWAGLSATAQARLEQLAAALQTADPNHLVTAHFLGGDQNWEHTSGQWLDFGFTYIGVAGIVAETAAGYAFTGPIPIILGETLYVDGTWDGPVPSRKKLRGTYWQALTHGAKGFIFGDENVWPFGGPNGFAGTNWQGALNSAYMQDAQRCVNFFLSLAWQKLAPDLSSTLVTAGRGSTGASYVTASLASDGSFAVIYIPPGTQITVNCSQLSGPVTASWFDPTNGTTSSAGSGLTGSQNFDPANNSTGDTDMVLLLVA